MIIVNAKVSVILPSLDVVDYIRECLDSVVKQTLHEMEIICIDAGSTDGTKEILEDYAKKDSRIILLDSTMKSYGKQVNIGLEYASGEYVAILETDDWIESDMYSFLYEHGVSAQLDYVAADFDMFWSLRNGSNYLSRQSLFDKEKYGWYGKILNSEEIATLRSSDYVLWKGIYNREFINVNHIRLNETPGAAFQDMGFLQQVKTYAQKAMYLDQSFYRYRRNRESASSNEKNGLRYYENEFRWMNTVLKLDHSLNEIHKKYYFLTMSCSFITKYEQILKSIDGDWQDERLNVPYIWFSKQISYAIKSGILDETMYKKIQWKQLKLLLSSQEEFAKYIMNREKAKRICERELLNKINNRQVIIFGCGIRGKRLLLFLDKNQKNIYSFCDNNITLQGRRELGFPIISPNDIKDELNIINGVILLSTKYGREEIYEQLSSMGVKSSQIVSDIPDEILQ